MFDILDSIYYDGPFVFRTSCNLENPQTEEEQAVLKRLRALKGDVAEELGQSICILANMQARRAFSTGARFGAQLMAQLLEEPS